MALSNVFNFVAGAVGAVNDIAIGARVAHREKRKAETKLAGEKQLAGLKHGYDLTLLDSRLAGEAKIRESILGTELAAKAKEGTLDRRGRLAVAKVNASAKAASRAASGAKNFNFLGDPNTIDHYAFPRVSGTKEERTDAMFAAFASDPAKYNRMKELYPNKMKQTLAQAFGRLISETAEKDATHTKITRYIPPMTSARLSGITLKDNPELYEDLKALNQENFETAFDPGDKAGFNKIMGAGAASDRVRNPEHYKLLKKAMWNWQKAQIKDYSKVGLPELFSAYTADTAHYSLTNTRGQPTGEHDPTTWKFHKFGASPMVALLQKQSPTSTDRNAAYEWLFSDENKKNWVDQNGMLNQDFFDAVKMFSLKNDLISRTKYRKRGDFQEVYIAAGLAEKHEAFKASYEQATENRPLAEKALQTLTKLTEAVRAGDMGSRTAVKLFAGVTAVPGMISEIGRGFRANVRRRIVNRAGIEVDYMTISLAKKVSGALAVVSAYRREPDKYDAMAMQGALETILAYQITSILQGGTGGRTISDQDVKLAMNIFGGTWTTAHRRLQHLENVKSLLRTAVHRGRIYDLLESADTNFATYRSVKNVLKLFPKLEDDLGNLGLGAQLQHVFDKTGRIVGKDPLDMVYSPGHESLIDRVELAKKHNSVVYGSYDSSQLKNWLTSYIVPGSEVVDSLGQNIKNFIINERKNKEGVLTHSLIMDADSWSRIKKAKQKSDSLGITNNLISLAIDEASKEAFNILTNKPVTIQWDKSGNGSYDIIGADETESVVPETKAQPENLVTSDTFIGDSIVDSIVNKGNFAAVGKDPYKNATPEAINKLIPYIRSLYRRESDPKKNFTNFDSATGPKPSWFTQDEWDKAPIIGGNKFGWAENIKHRTGVEKYRMKVELGDRAIEHIAKTAIGEAATGDIDGQKAVIDVIYIRSWSPDPEYRNQREKAAGVEKYKVKKIKTAFFSNVLDNMKVA